MSLDSAGMEAAVRVLRDVIRSPMNAVFHELIVAARTDAGLAEKLRPTFIAYYLQVLKLGWEVFDIESDPDRVFESFLMGVITIIEGETAGRVFGVDADLEERRLRWLIQVAEATLPSPAPPRHPLASGTVYCR